MKKNKSKKIRAKSPDTINLRVVPLNGQLWFVAKDVCSLLQLVEHRALAILSENDVKTSEIETRLGGQVCQIVSSKGYYALVWHYRIIQGAGLAEWFKNNQLQKLKESGMLTPETVEEFTTGFDELMRNFELDMAAKNPNFIPSFTH